MNSTVFELFCYWIREREAVRRRKEAGDRYLSEDPIFRTQHFCNVRREDDRVTKEIRAVVTKLVEHEEDLPHVYTMARMFNKASTVKDVLELCASGDDPIAYLKNKRYHEPIFHTAYVVSTCGQKMDKVDYVFGVMRQVMKLEVPRTSLRSAFEALRSVDGLGSFMAGQVVADLKNDRYLTEKNLIHDDWWSFSVMGPGSKKGLDYMFGSGTTENNYPDRMKQLISALPVDILGLELHQQDIQNCLCEFSKYMRIKQGDRGRRRPYHAHNER